MFQQTKYISAGKNLNSSSRYTVLPTWPSILIPSSIFTKIPTTLWDSEAWNFRSCRSSGIGSQLHIGFTSGSQPDVSIKVYLDWSLYSPFLVVFVRAVAVFSIDDDCTGEHRFRVRNAEQRDTRALPVWNDGATLTNPFRDIKLYLSLIRVPYSSLNSSQSLEFT